MIEQAESENHKARHMFNYAFKAEAVHVKLYAQVLAAVKEGKDLDVTDIYLCPVCCHVEIGAPSGACSICGAKAEKYLQV